MASGNATGLQALDLQSCDNLTEECLYRFLESHGSQLLGLNLAGIPSLIEQFWSQSIPFLRKIRYASRILFFIEPDKSRMSFWGNAVIFKAGINYLSSN